MNGLPDAANAFYGPGKQPAKAAATPLAVAVRDPGYPQVRQNFAKTSNHPNKQTVTSQPLPWPLFA